MALTRTVNDNPGLLLGSNEWYAETFDGTGSVTYPVGTMLGRITANARIQVYDNGAVDGTQVAIGVLTNELVTTATTISFRMLVSGRVREEQTTEYNGGTPAVMTAVARAQLRDVTILSIASDELLIEDNA